MAIGLTIVFGYVSRVPFVRATYGFMLFKSVCIQCNMM